MRALYGVPPSRPGARAGRLLLAAAVAGVWGAGALAAPPELRAPAAVEATPLGGLGFYLLFASDPDGDTLSFLRPTPADLPAGASLIDLGTAPVDGTPTLIGLLVWEPTRAQVGTHVVPFEVSDSLRLKLTQARTRLADRGVAQRLQPLGGLGRLRGVRPAVDDRLVELARVRRVVLRLLELRGVEHFPGAAAAADQPTATSAAAARCCDRLMAFLPPAGSRPPRATPCAGVRRAALQRAPRRRCPHE